MISARNPAVKATTPEAKMEADNVLTGALRQLFAVAEAYPDLKANTNFTQLQASLEDTETRLAMHARATTTACSRTTTPSRRSRLSSLPASSSLRSARASRPPKQPARPRPSCSSSLTAHL